MSIESFRDIFLDRSAVIAFAINQDVLIIGTPPAADSIEDSQPLADDLRRDLLRLDVDRRIDLEAALGDACRVFFFEVLADLFNRIIPRCRLWK
jgi:hypothetical protein